MKNKNENYFFSKADDLSVTPSDELNRRTIDAMENVTARSCRAHWTDNAYRRVPSMRRILVCSALICAAFMLMSAGYKVFSYLAYVPGEGIVTHSIDGVYTLKEAVKFGSNYIEAMSFVPLDEGEHAGEWEVTVLTDYPTPYAYELEKGYTGPKMTITVENKEYELTWQGETDRMTRYTGYLTALNETEDYDITWLNYAETITMLPLRNSVYSTFKYPVSDGVTIICFPISEGSDKLIYDFVFEPQSENMKFLNDNSRNVDIVPYEVTAADINGKIYRVNQTSGTLMWLDSYLEAPIAQISIDSVEISFKGVSDLGKYSFTIPEDEEIVYVKDDGVFIDTHGIKAAFEWILSSADGQKTGMSVYPTDDRYYIFMREAYRTLDFEEEVSDVSFWLWSADSVTGAWRNYDSGKATHYLDTNDYTSKEVVYWFDIEGAGDKSIDDGTMPVTFGDDIKVGVIGVSLTLDGDWTIDFTSPAEESAAE